MLHTPQEAPYSHSDTPIFRGNRRLRIGKNIWKTQFSGLGNTPLTLDRSGHVLTLIGFFLLASSLSFADTAILGAVTLWAFLKRKRS
jgi:hypothetical protein